MQQAMFARHTTTRFGAVRAFIVNKTRLNNINNTNSIGIFNISFSKTNTRETPTKTDHAITPKTILYPHTHTYLIYNKTNLIYKYCLNAARNMPPIRFIAFKSNIVGAIIGRGSCCGGYSIRHARRMSTANAPEPPTEPAHIKSIVDQIAQLKFYEVTMLNEALKRELKIPDFQPVANVGVQVEGDEVGERKTKKTAFTVKLVKFEDSKKVSLIKEIKKIITGINLVEAKRFVEDCPKVIKSNITKQEADELQKQIEEAGGKVSID